MAHTFTKGMPLHLRELHGEGGEEPEVLRVNTSLGQIQDIRWPIEGGALGAVRVGVSEDALRELLVSNVLKMVGITLVILLLAAILIFRLSKILTRPLHHLMERAEHISKGHFSGRAITFPTTDEIGRLANAMNDMERHLREGAQERSLLLRHIMTAQEEERKRIAMELHDESGQTLTALLFSLRALANETDDENMQKALLAIRDETADTLARLRSLAVELHPPALDELGNRGGTGEAGRGLSTQARGGHRAQLYDRGDSRRRGESGGLSDRPGVSDEYRTSFPCDTGTDLPDRRGTHRALCEGQRRRHHTRAYPCGATGEPHGDLWDRGACTLARGAHGALR